MLQSNPSTSNIQASTEICSNNLSCNYRRYFKKEEKYLFINNIIHYFKRGKNFRFDIIERLKFLCSKEQKQKIRNCFYFAKNDLINTLYKTSFLNHLERQTLNKKYLSFRKNNDFQNFDLYNLICKVILKIDFKSPEIKKEIDTITSEKIQSMYHKRTEHDFANNYLSLFDKKSKTSESIIDLQKRKINFEKYYNESNQKILTNFIKIFENFYDTNRLFLINNLNYLTNLNKSQKLFHPDAQIIRELVYSLYYIISNGFPIIFTNHINYEYQTNNFTKNNFKYFKNFKIFNCVIKAIQLFFQEVKIYENKSKFLQRLSISLESLLINQNLTDNPNLDSVTRLGKFIYINLNDENLNSKTFLNTPNKSTNDNVKVLVTKNDLIEIFIEIIIKQITKYLYENNIDFNIIKKKAKFFLAYYSFFLSKELGFDNFLVTQTQGLEFCFELLRPKLKDSRKRKKYNLYLFLEKFIDYCVFGQKIFFTNFENFFKHFDNTVFYAKNINSFLSFESNISSDNFNVNFVELNREFEFIEIYIDLNKIKKTYIDNFNQAIDNLQTSFDNLNHFTIQLDNKIFFNHDSWHIEMASIIKKIKNSRYNLEKLINTYFDSLIIKLDILDSIFIRSNENKLFDDKLISTLETIFQAAEFGHEECNNFVIYFLSLTKKDKSFLKGIKIFLERLRP